MRKFDSVKTMNRFHEIFKNLSTANQKELSRLVDELFGKKTISEEGEYTTFKITKQDLEQIKSQLS